MTSESPGPRRGAPARLPLAGLTRALRAPLLGGLALLAAACSGDETARDFEPVTFPELETALDYEVKMTGAPREAAEEDLRATLSLFRRQEDGAPSLAILRRRAEQDVEAVKTVLRSYGYYAAEATVTVEELPAGAAEAPAAETAGRDGAAQDSPAARRAAPATAPGGAARDAAEAVGLVGPRPSALARVEIDAGPAYVLERHQFKLAPVPEGPPVALPEAGNLGSPLGKRADAGRILAAEQQAVAYLLWHGRPWAKLRGRRAVIDPETATMRVTSRIAPGPYAEFDSVVVEGREQVSADYIRTYRPFEKGEAVDRRQLTEYQSALMGTQLFGSVIVDVPDKAPEPGGDAAVPVTVRVEEAPARTVTAGLRYNTDTGPEVRGSFVHRNLFNEGERLEILGEAGLERQRLLFEGRKPQFGFSGQDLTTSLEARHVESDAYDEQGVTYALGLERRLEEEWTVGLGGLAEYSLITERGVEQDVLLFGLPAFMRYDGTDDLLNPKEGVRARLLGAPYGGTLDGRGVQFLHLETGASGYLALNEDEDLILAGRARLGSILSDSLADVPATHRLYSGGGGSVRGYQERFVGPLDARNDPIGGRSVAEIGAELRAPISGDIGGALFVEAGTVSRDVAPDFSAGVRFAAGAGLRYYSPVGPIRFDVGVPLNPRDADDPFAFYFSIGQAY